MSLTIWFWLLFLVVNSFYFLPRYLLEMFHSDFSPLRGFLQGSLGQRLRHILIRKNFDVFRISVDLYVLAFLYPLLLRDDISVWQYTVFLCLYFSLSLLYQLYYHAFHKIYQLDPVFFHDFLMLKTAVQIFVHEYDRKNFLMTIGAMAIGLSAYVLLYYLISIGATVTFGMGSFILMGLLTLGSLYSVLHYPYAKYPFLTFQSQFQSCIRNVRLSRQSKKSIASLTLRYMKQFNVDQGVVLSEKPNIYFIVVESYGSAAWDARITGELVRNNSISLEKKLFEKGWGISSGLTVAPVTGGASWISYTSMMYGLNVRNQGVYLAMLKNKRMQEYDSLFHWLKRQGYTTFRLSSLGGYEKMAIPYESYSRLYGIDHWIKYKDLEYTGEHYGFGPSPPDQFALWKGDLLARDIAGEAPRALFFISQNSHTPYESPESIAEDWRSLNSPQDVSRKSSAFWSRPKFDKYGSAITYQLQYLVDFIVKSGTEKDIFILVGDHQPPSISVAFDNFETPLHIIAKDPAFLRHWGEYGLAPGLIPGATNTPLQQEALHWAMLRNMIRTYAPESSVLPAFLPHGIPY